MIKRVKKLGPTNVDQPEKDSQKTFRVSSTTDPKNLGNAICDVVREEKRGPDLIAIGAGSVNNAVKGIAAANYCLRRDDGVELFCVPDFCSTTEREEKTGREMTAIRMQIQMRSLEG